MDIERLRQLRLAHPYKPFVLLLEDGRRFVIDEPYYLSISPTKQFVLVVPENDRAVWFAPQSVKDVIMLENSAASQGPGA
jgi:hypothetical protein